MRCKDGGIEFPLVLGRDFCGEIVQKGLGISSRDLEVGDEVWGVVPVHLQGCHADYVAVEKYCVRVDVFCAMFTSSGIYPSLFLLVAI